jgi:hypothetical protein
MWDDVVFPFDEIDLISFVNKFNFVNYIKELFTFNTFIRNIQSANTT